DPALVLLVPPGALLFLAGGQLLEPLLGVGVAGAAAGTTPGGEQVAQLVARHGEQPAAEGAAPGVVLEGANAPGDGQQYLLGQVGGVGVLQAVSAGEAEDQRRVQVHELRPRLVVLGVAQADEEAGAGGERVAHTAIPPPSSTGGRRYLIAP